MPALHEEFRTSVLRMRVVTLSLLLRTFLVTLNVAIRKVQFVWMFTQIMCLDQEKLIQTNRDTSLINMFFYYFRRQDLKYPQRDLGIAGCDTGPNVNLFVTSGTHMSHLTKSLFKSAGITVSHFFHSVIYLEVSLFKVEKVGYCYPSGLKNTLCKCDIYVPLVTKVFRQLKKWQLERTL
jgi:hypothetical protein